MMTKLLEAHSIPVPPRLAGLLKQVLGRTGTGFDEGAFLQQLHYWTLNSETTGWVVEGTKWVYNSLKSWQAQFPWMTQYGLRKAIANLKKLGLIQATQHWISQYKRVMFYRIDYEQLNALTGGLCDQIARRGVEGDRVDVMTDRTAGPENTSDTSFSEQKTGVVLERVLEEKAVNSKEPLVSEHSTESREKFQNPRLEYTTPASSGNDVKFEVPMFPELLETVAQAVALPSGSSLPPSLRLAIEQFPDRVQPAIQYLNFQKQRQSIQNPIGYLYRALVEDWNLTIPEPSLLPIGFREWFDRARSEGLVLAAMTIEGIHHTLHVEQGWIPTIELISDMGTSAIN